MARIQYELAKKSDIKKWMAEARNTQGIALHIQGNYVEAIDYYTMGLTLAEKIGDKKSLSSTFNNIGIIYKDQGNEIKALEYFEKSLKIKEEMNNQLGISNSLGNIAEIHLRQGDIDEAQKLFQRGLKIQEKLGNKQGIAGFLNNLGSVFSEQKDYAKALKYYNRGLKLREEIGDKKGMASSLSNIALIYIIRHDYNNAILYGEKALSVAQKAGMLIETNEAARVLYESYKARGDYQKSLSMHELYLNTTDSIKNEKAQNKIIQQDYQYRYEKKHLEDSVKSADERKVNEALFAAERSENKHNQLIARQQSQWFLYLYGVLALTVLFAAFIFNRFRITSKQKNIIEDQKKQVDHAFNELEAKNTEIMDSISYARRIQTAMLPSDATIKTSFPESFVLYKPKDVVAGDFYWLEYKNGKTLFAAADCTGHGVPGAMVSVVCNNGLNRSVREYGLTDPGEILDKTREIVIQEFESSQHKMTDGMDIALCALDDYVLQYAGANNSLWIIRDGELIELKADKQPIGNFDNPKPYNTRSFNLKKGDSIYAFTDGFADQFGGEQGKKMQSKQFKELLVGMQNESLSNQREQLESLFEKWKGKLEQVDDVCIIGVRI